MAFGLSNGFWSIIAVLFLALGLFGSGFGMGYSIANDRHAEAEQEAQLAATIKQKEISDGYANALNEANIRQQVLFNDYARLRDTHISLRESLQNNLPQYASDAEIDAVLTRGELLAECSDRYAELAAKADKHVHDLRTIRDAWSAVVQ